MAYNEKLAGRTRELISISHKKVEEKAMFGGLCFMVNDKMCVGVEKDRLMIRLDPAVLRKRIGKRWLYPNGFYRKANEGICICNC